MSLFGFFSIRGQTAIDFYNKGDFQIAAVLFEKEYFENQTDSSLLFKSYSYKHLENYEAAFQCLERIQNINVGYEKAFLSFMSNDFERARQQILRMKVGGDEFDEKMVLLEVLVENGRGNFEGVKELLNQNHQLLNLDKAEVESILPKSYKSKNEQKAYNISLILPGIGQWYAGHFGKGVVSGGIQTGIVAFTGWSYLNGYYLTGTLSGAALFYTFYLGGARYARDLALQTNRKRSSLFQENLLSIYNRQ